MARLQKNKKFAEVAGDSGADADVGSGLNNSMNAIENTLITVKHGGAPVVARVGNEPEHKLGALLFAPLEVQARAHAVNRRGAVEARIAAAKAARHLEKREQVAGAAAHSQVAVDTLRARDESSARLPAIRRQSRLTNAQKSAKPLSDPLRDVPLSLAAAPLTVQALAWAAATVRVVSTQG